MGGKTLVALLVVLVCFGAVVSAQEDSADTLLEQQKALAAEAMGPQERVGVFEGMGPKAPGDLLFVGVDDATVSTYNLLPADGTAYPQFTGFEPWGAALIPDSTPGNGVVFFNDGSTLYRWPANGSAELCCTLTYLAATASVVSMTYDPVGMRLLFTRNVGDEGVYALPVVAGSCPAACEMTQEILYTAADYDFGGLALDTATGDIYGTNDDSTPGPRGVYQINSDGSATLLAAYPGSETDIDGLACGEGKLYLITDQPGDIYVLDIATATYETPIPNPWTTSEVFSAGAYGQGLIPVELRSLTIE